MHHAMNLPLFRGSPFVRDPELRKVGVVRIYDILLDYNDVLMQTDHILRQILLQPEFQHEMGTAELHHLLASTVRSSRSRPAAGTSRSWQRPTGPACRVSVRRPVTRPSHERGRAGASGQQAAGQPVAGRQRDDGHRAGCQAGRPQDRCGARRRRLTEEFHPADRAADSGSVADPRGGARFLHPVHRRPSGYGGLSGPLRTKR